MVAQSGINILIKDGTGTSATAIAALQSTNIKINGKSIDTTNRDSGGWQELLSGGGITNVSLEGDGVVTDGSQVSVMMDRALTRTLNPYTALLGAGITLAGSWMLTSFEASGSYDKEQTYKMSFDSSGTIVRTGT